MAWGGELHIGFSQKRNGRKDEARLLEGKLHSDVPMPVRLGGLLPRVKNRKQGQAFEQRAVRSLAHLEPVLKQKLRRGATSMKHASTRKKLCNSAPSCVNQCQSMPPLWQTRSPNASNQSAESTGCPHRTSNPPPFAFRLPGSCRLRARRRHVVRQQQRQRLRRPRPKRAKVPFLLCDLGGTL